MLSLKMAFTLAVSLPEAHTRTQRNGTKMIIDSLSARIYYGRYGKALKDKVLILAFLLLKYILDIHFFMDLNKKRQCIEKHMCYHGKETSLLDTGKGLVDKQNNVYLINVDNNEYLISNSWQSLEQITETLWALSYL